MEAAQQSEKAPGWMVEKIAPASSFGSFDAALSAYLDFIRDDYENNYGEPIINNPIAAQVKARMIRDFRRGLSTSKGAKYVAVRTGEMGDDDVILHRAAHSFIDAEGFIWKPAGWKGPTKNFSRGNIYKPESYKRTVRWSGI